MRSVFLSAARLGFLIAFTGVKCFVRQVRQDLARPSSLTFVPKVNEEGFIKKAAWKIKELQFLSKTLGFLSRATFDELGQEAEGPPAVKERTHEFPDSEFYE